MSTPQKINIHADKIVTSFGYKCVPYYRLSIRGLVLQELSSLYEPHDQSTTEFRRSYVGVVRASFAHYSHGYNLTEIRRIVLRIRQ
jgi:hypothetical protein